MPIVHYEDMKARHKKPSSAPKEKLPCDTCSSRFGGDKIGGHCGGDSNPSITCTTAMIVTGTAWIEVAMARRCKGPEHLKEKLMKSFIEGSLMNEITPPDS